MRTSHWFTIIYVYMSDRRNQLRVAASWVIIPICVEIQYQKDQQRKVIKVDFSIFVFKFWFCNFFWQERSEKTLYAMPPWFSAPKKDIRFFFRAEKLYQFFSPCGTDLFSAASLPGPASARVEQIYFPRRINVKITFRAEKRLRFY